MSGLRWWLFKRLCPLVWRICPQPHRDCLFGSMSFDRDMWTSPEVWQYAPDQEQ